MKLKLSLLCLASILLIFGIATREAGAQSSNSVIMNVSPTNPSPHENTNITLTSYVNNLDVALISWSVNGKTAISGIGRKTFSVTAPAAGGEATVSATISLPSGPVNVSTVIKPSVMVLLWQATDSYVPPFYRGKALPTPDSEIKVVAMPEVRSGSGNVPAHNMTYYWKKDYTNNVEGSGYGKSFFVYTNDYLEDSNTISVTASTVDQMSSADSSITIGSVAPKILFYKNDSVFGIHRENALPATHAIQETETIEAVPYFISPKEIQHPALIWNWSINDSRVNVTGFKKNLMPLLAEAGAHGTSRLKLQIENREKIFQTTSREMIVEF